MKIFGEARGDTASVMLAGPPDRMMPRRPSRDSAWSTRLNGTISEYTPASRTRRAINVLGAEIDDEDVLGHGSIP